MREWLDDFAEPTTAFLTRLPMPHPDGARPRILRGRSGCSVIGALIGVAIGLFCLLLRARSACRILPRRRLRSAAVRS